MRKYSIHTASVLIPLVFVSCMKSRYQLREESESPHSPVVSAPEPQAVKPQDDYIVEEMKTEMTRFAGKLEDLERHQKELSSDTESKKLIERVTAVEEKIVILQEAVSKLQASVVAEDPASIFALGEKYFAHKEYKKAIIEFSKFPEKFPRSAHMPQALYKIASAFEALGLKSDAKGFYQELVEKYPKSSEAKKSRKKAK